MRKDPDRETVLLLQPSVIQFRRLLLQNREGELAKNGGIHADLAG